MDFLDKIAEISVDDGLKFCGSQKSFEKFVKNFYFAIDEKIAEIERAYEEGNYNFYTIKVHSLKSTARIMGALDLSKKAEALELAGKNGNYDFIKENNKEILDYLKCFKEKLSYIESLDNSENSIVKLQISDEELKDAYEALVEFVPQMDYDAVESVINELDDYLLPKDDKEFIDSMRKSLDKYDWDSMESMIKKIV